MRTIGWVALAAAAFGFTQSGHAATIPTSLDVTNAAGVGVDFTNITVNATPGVVITGLDPFINGGQFGIELTYASSATAGTVSDVSLSYNATGVGGLLSTAFLSLTATDSGNGTSSLNETLDFPNGNSLSFGLPQTSASFDPVASLFAVKDQENFGNDGSAAASALTDSFSLSPPVAATPLPGTLPLFATGLVGFWGWTRRRKAQQAA